MCFEPTTLAYLTLAASAVGTGVQYEQQRQSANVQADAIEREQNAQLNDQARIMEQQRQSDMAQANAYADQARARMAHMETILGEGGSGVTGDRKLTALGLEQGQDMVTLADNARKRSEDLSFGSYATKVRGSNALASISQPSLLGSGLTLASAGLRFNQTMNEIGGQKKTSANATEGTH